MNASYVPPGCLLGAWTPPRCFLVAHWIRLGCFLVAPWCFVYLQGRERKTQTTCERERGATGPKAGRRAGSKRERERERERQQARVSDRECVSEAEASVNV